MLPQNTYLPTSPANDNIQFLGSYPNTTTQFKPNGIFVHKALFTQATNCSRFCLVISRSFLVASTAHGKFIVTAAEACVQSQNQCRFSRPASFWYIDYTFCEHSLAHDHRSHYVPEISPTFQVPLDTNTKRFPIRPLSEDSLMDPVAIWVSGLPSVISTSILPFPTLNLPPTPFLWDTVMTVFDACHPHFFRWICLCSSLVSPDFTVGLHPPSDST